MIANCSLIERDKIHVVPNGAIHVVPVNVSKPHNIESRK